MFVNDIFLCRLCLISPDSKCLVKIFENEEGEQSSNRNSLLADKIFSTVGCKIPCDDGLPGYLCKDCIMTVDFISTYNQWFSDTRAYITHIQTSLEMYKDTGGCDENGHQILSSLSEKRNTKETDSYVISLIRGLSKISLCDSSQVSLVIKDVLTKICGTSSTSFESEHQEHTPFPNFLPCNDKCNDLPEPKDQTEILSEVGGIDALKSVRNHIPTSMMHDFDSEMTEDHVSEDVADCYEDDRSTESKTNSGMCQKVGEDIPSIHTLMCPECKSTFSKKSLLSKHLLSHFGATEKYQCKICRKIFISTSELQRHTRVHLGLKPYKCTKCSKFFSQKNLLDNHLSWHEGRKNYLCELCGESLSTKPNLRMHMKSLHTLGKEKPFICEVCGNSFIRKHHLENHTTVHASARPHQCTVCGLTFKRLSQLQEHEYGHSGEKKYTCKDCNRAFSTKRVLTVHMLLHSGVKQHHCTVCTKSFARRGGLQAHLKTHSKHDSNL